MNAQCLLFIFNLNINSSQQVFYLFIIYVINWVEVLTNRIFEFVYDEYFYYWSFEFETSTTDVLEKSSCTCGFMPDIYYTVSITGHIAPITDYY